MLSLGQLYTDDDDSDNNNNDDDNDTRQTNHDYIGLLACMPNKPKGRHIETPCLQTQVISD